MTEHDTKDYEHVWPPYGITLPSSDLRTNAPVVLRTLDPSASPERVQIWCEALERRIEHLECTMQRLLNPSEEPDADEVAE